MQPMAQIHRTESAVLKPALAAVFKDLQITRGFESLLFKKKR